MPSVNGSLFFGKAFTECCYCKFCKWNWENICLAGYSHWCRQLGWALPLCYRQGFPGAEFPPEWHFPFPSELRELQEEAASGVRQRGDVWGTLLGKQRGVSQHFPLMLPAVTVSDSQGVPRMLLLCISLSPSIWLERSATLVTGWAISTSISYRLGDLGI